jgi:hypothetical protein
VALALALEESQKKLALATRQEREGQGELVEKARTEEDRRLSALRGVNQSLEQQRQALAGINAALDPAKLRERVELSLKEEEARKKLERATTQERDRQQHGTGAGGFARRVFGRLAGGEGAHPADATGDYLAQKLGPLGKLLGVLGKSVAGPAKSPAQQPVIGVAQPATPSVVLPAGTGAAIGQQLAQALAGASQGKTGTGPASGSAASFGKAVASLAGSSKGGGGANVAAGAGAGAAGGLAKSLGGLAEVAGPVGLAIAGVVAGLGLAYEAFNKLTDTVVGFVGKANPVYVQRWQFALDDAQAVIGQKLVPVLDLMTEGVRLVGDTLATILPSASDVKDALSPIAEALKDVRSEAATLAPVIRQLISTGLGTLKIALQVATLPLRAFAALLRGLGVIGEDKLTSSVGAAARPASFGGVEDYVKKTYESAFSAGAGKEVELPKVLSKLEIAIDKLLIWLQRAGQGADAGKKVLAGAGSALDLVNPFSPLVRGLLDW